MFNQASRFVSGILIFLFSLFIMNCQDGGSELPNELRGEVVSKNSVPAAKVKVGLYSVNYIPADTGNSGMAFTTETDAKGKYAFKNIPSGRYNLVGLRDSLGFFRDSVSVTGAAEFGRDSLELLGTLSGTVQLQPRDEPRNAIIQVMGTDNYVNVDSAGAFTLSGLAGGFYRLRVSVALPDYVPLFKEVQAHTGNHDTLASPLVPFFSGIPVVLNILASLDTASGIAKITWHPVSYPALLTYLVYRDRENAVDLSDTPINAARIEDSIYYDTLYRFDGSTQSWGDSLGHDWEYRVRVQAKNMKIGVPDKPTVLRAVSPTILSTRVSIERLGGKAEEIFKGDTVRFVADYANSLLANRYLSWVHGVSDTLRKVDLTGKSGKDTLIWVAASALGLDSLRAEITDANGKTWSAKLSIKLVASRILGNLKSSASWMDAYDWQGNILHVGKDTLGRIVIGIFNLATNLDTVLSAVAKSDTLATALSGSKLYLMNTGHPDFPGANLLSFDLLSGVWGKESDPADATLENCAAAMGGKLYALSRYGTAMDSLKLSILDLATHAWTEKKLNRQAAMGAMMQVFNLTVQNGDLYLATTLESPYLISIERYLTATDKWFPLPQPERIRYSYRSRFVGLKGTLYNLAGKNMDLIFPTAVNRFDPERNEWIPAPDFLMGRESPGVVGIGSSIYLVSGNIMNVNTATVEEYRPDE